MTALTPGEFQELQLVRRAVRLDRARRLYEEIEGLTALAGIEVLRLALAEAEHLGSAHGYAQGWNAYQHLIDIRLSR